MNPAGSLESYRWFCDAKIYTHGIPWPKIESTLAQANGANPRPDYVLLAVYPRLTHPCKEAINTYRSSRAGFPRVEIWEGEKLEERIYKHSHILKRFFPHQWSAAYEADIYLNEVNIILSKLYEQAQPVWKGVEHRPFTELLQFTAKKHRSVEQYDESQKLTPLEQKVIQLTMMIAERLQQFIARTLNLPENTILISCSWDEDPEVKVLIPLLNTDIIRNELRNAAGRLLGGMTPKRYFHLKQSGIIAAASAWKPWKNKNIMQAYLVWHPELSRRQKEEEKKS